MGGGALGASIDARVLGPAEVGADGGGGTDLGAVPCGGGGGDRNVGSPIELLSVRLASLTCVPAFRASLCLALDAISVS